MSHGVSGGDGGCSTDGEVVVVLVDVVVLTVGVSVDVSAVVESSNTVSSGVELSNRFGSVANVASVVVV